MPPRSPHLNGKVERVQRTVPEAFWPIVDVGADDVGDQLAPWVHHYNRDRLREAPGGLCPIDRVCERRDKTPLRDGVDAAYDETRKRIQLRGYAVERALRNLK